MPDSAAEIDSAIERGRIAITSNPDALARAGRIDVVIDATGNPNIGTRSRWMPSPMASMW